MNLLDIELISKEGDFSEYKLTFVDKTTIFTRYKVNYGNHEGIEYDWTNGDPMPEQVMDFIEDWLDGKFEETI